MILVTKALRSTDLVIDTSTKISRSEARAIRSAGVIAVARYVFFGPARAEDLDGEELEGLVDEDLIVFVVQHPREPKYNVLSDQTGRDDAMWAIQNCIAAGYDPAKVIPTDGVPPALFCDMEGVQNPEGAYPHAAAWCTRVAFAGFRVGDYIGFQSGLTSAQLNTLPAVPLFWNDAAPLALRPASTRGCVLHQLEETTLCGIGVDKNKVLQDGVLYGVAKGDAPAPDPGDPAMGIVTDTKA